MKHSDLELTLRSTGEHTYSVGFRFQLAGDAAEQRAEVEPLFQHDPEAFEADLSRDFFTSEIKTLFAGYRKAAQSVESSLRVRLSVAVGSPRLHQFSWEALEDPDVPGQPLFLGETTILSRFLPATSDSRPVRLRSSRQLSVLLVVANPQHLEEYDLPPVNVAEQLDAAQKALLTAGSGIAIQTLAPGGEVKLDTIVDELRKGYDVLYLVCHGKLTKEGPRLYLEDAGSVAGGLLASRVRELNQRPSLVVLASCQSAGNKGVGLAGVGPLLAAIGVPAVLAMQGSISMETNRRFMLAFFAELLRDGQIDRAVAVARGKVRDRRDCWMPALFLRLVDGKLWYAPGFESNSDSVCWEDLVERIREHECVPIIGMEILEPLWGSTAEIAAALAEQNNYPLEEHQTESLRAVAQYIRTSKVSPKAFDRELDDWLKQYLRVPVAGDGVWERLRAAGKQRRQTRLEDAHNILASLPFPIYLTTCQDRLLEDALVEKGRTPVSDYVRWNPTLRDVSRFPRPDVAADYYPSEAAPFVYHLLGDAREPQSRVITEDHLMDYMLNLNRQETRTFTPTFIGKALGSNSLLFLGFHFKDPAFQVLLRNTLNFIRNPEEKDLWVGVQFPPEPDRYRRVQAARAYLEKNLGQQLGIYWGGTQDFLDELAHNLPADLRLRLSRSSAETAA